MNCPRRLVTWVGRFIAASYWHGILARLSASLPTRLFLDNFRLADNTFGI